MAKDTDGLLLTASLDIEDSYGKIKEDIKKLNVKLANDNSARVKIVGGLDLSKTQSLIESQIATIGKNLKLNIGQIDFKSIGNTQNITNGFNNIQTQANNVTNSLTNLAEDMTTKLAIYKNNLVSAREEWKSQGLYVGAIQEKTVSLARSLSNIKKPDKFNEWVDEWTTLNQKATQLKTNLDSQVVTQNKIYEIQAKLVNLDPRKNAEEITFLNSKLQTEQKELSNLQMQSKIYSILISLEEQEKYITEQTAKAREQLATAKAKSNDKTISQRISELNSYKNSLNDVITKLNVLNNSTVFTKNSSNPQVVQIEQQISQLLTEYQTLANTLQNGNLTPTDMQSAITRFQQLDTQFKQVSNSARKLKASMSAENSMQRQAQQAELLVEKVKKLRSEIIAYQNANSKAMKSNAKSSNGLTYSAEIDNLLVKLKNASSVTDTEFKKISASFRSLRAEIKSVGLEGNTMLGSLWANIKKFSNWMGITMVTASIAREIRGMFTDVAELDDALIDLRKTFQGTSDDLQEFYYSANDVAKQLGVTTQEVINTASSWSRLGYNTKEAAIEMSKYTSMFKEISPGMSMEDATDGLLSVMKAFDVNVNDVLDGVMSKINKIGNDFGTSNDEIIQMLMRSSSAMREANNSLEDTIALETAAVEITRDEASVGMYCANHTAMCA